MQDIVKSANTTSELSSTAGETLNQVGHSVVAISDLNMRIAASAEEQSYATEEINSRTEDIGKFTREVSGSIVEVKQAADSLSEIAKKMRSGVSIFKLN